MNPLPAIADLPGGVPVLLFPVRVETRYLPDGAGGTNLCCRVYPAAPELDTHEPELTSDETALGADYQRGVATATSADQTHAAWLTLCSQLGAPPSRLGRTGDRAGCPRPRHPRRHLDPAGAGRRAAGLLGGARLPQRAAGIRGRRPARGERSPASRTGARPGDRGGPGGRDPARQTRSPGWSTTPPRSRTAWRSQSQLGTGPLDLDRLVVLGAKGLPPADGAARVTRLLDAQRYTGEIALLIPGHPEQQHARRAFGLLDVDGRPDPAQPPPAARAGRRQRRHRLAAALGVDPAVARRDPRGRARAAPLPRRRPTPCCGRRRGASSSGR